MPAVGPEVDNFHRLVGQAVEEYALVEDAQSRVLAAILNTETRQAKVIFFTVQNVRSRNEMFLGLLEQLPQRSVNKASR